MLKTCSLLLLLLLGFRNFSWSQCLTALPSPPCTGVEPLVTEADYISSGTTKWFYGATSSLNTVTVDGGTLVICGDLTIDKFYMETGTIFIRPGARLVIASGLGSGLVFKGASIYNYGTCEIQRNLSLDAGATASNPNRVINATGASVFKMGNQYLVINNRFSWFVNNGDAEFWGIITDAQASAASVCLGYSSVTRMSILINKVLNSYSVPTGSACLYVRQFSQFYNALTSNPGLFACLGAGHSSDAACIPFGCQPNNWGAARVFTNCANCGVLAVLGTRFASLEAIISKQGGTELKWRMEAPLGEGDFVLQRSSDGVHYTSIDTVTILDGHHSFFNAIDHNPLPGNNYYMIRYIQPRTGLTIDSKSIKVYMNPATRFQVFPVPFQSKFTIQCEFGLYPQKIVLTDLTGRDIRIRTERLSQDRFDVTVLDPIGTDVYILHLLTGKGSISRTIFKE